MRLLLVAVVTIAGAQPAQAQLAVPNEAGLAYGHVHLKVSDIEAHTRLWVDHFGGQVVERGPLTAVKLPNLLVVLTERVPAGPTQGSVVDHFGFKVRNTAWFVERWRDAGLEVGPEFTGAEGMPNAYVMAPDGVWIELQEDPSLHVPVAGYHVHFWTPDVEALLEWYETVFGLSRRPRGRITTTTDVPGMNLSFAATDSPTAPTAGRAVDHIGFEVDDLEAFCRMLGTKGVACDRSSGEPDRPGLKTAFLTDPAGTTIALTEGLDRY